MPIDPRELARFKHAKPAMVMFDRECARCGYNLRGLREGTVCPECGQPMPAPVAGNSARLRDNLSDAPLRYLRLLACGLSLMMLGCIVGALMLYLAPPGILKAVLLGGAGGVWWLGVFLVTGPRLGGPNSTRDAVLDSGRLRQINRIIQAAWIVAGVGWLGVAQMKGITFVVFMILAGIGPLTGLLGLVPLSVQLSALADWAGHTSLGDRFRATAWSIAVSGVLVLCALAVQLLTTVLAGFLALAFSAFVIVLVVAQIAFLVWLLQLMLTIGAAIGSARFAQERDRRRVERLKRGFVEPERHCESCGYSLLGLSHLTPCPECGWVDPEVRGSNLAAIAALRPREKPR